MRGHLYYAGSFVLMATLPGCGNAGGESQESATGSVNQACGEQRPSLTLKCEKLASQLRFPDTTFTSSTRVAAGELKLAGKDVPAHCLLTGKMHERVSPIDGQTYSMGFEMRMPLDWNQRFFYQANGGIDGNVVTAMGLGSGGGPMTGALMQGYAVISSDAGHNAAQIPAFGLDPEARLEYGYEAVGKLTPMAKSVLWEAYRRWPAYSYIGGCSNGGRHTMVAAARYPYEFDGYLVGSPGFNLPKAAVASIYGAQQYASVAGSPPPTIPAGPFAGMPDLSAGFTVPEQQLVTRKVLERCDALDGLADGIVHATAACQRTFRLDRDVPTCTGARDGTCLTDAQKTAIGNLYAGPKDSLGKPIYSTFPFDAGIAGSGNQFWEFLSPLLMDSIVAGFVFQTPPVDPMTFNPIMYALTSNVEQLAASTYASNATYTESSESFMVPPHPTRLDGMRDHGGRMLVYHGTSDPIFSSDDTAHWYTHLEPSSKEAVRLYLVPGMNHCADGPSVDQFDLLTPLARWVEQGEPPHRIVASARGPENPGGVNNDLPATWSTTRTRPLCEYPQVAVYRGGNIESADSFVCRR